jgi:RNA polymerase sigma-70 factor (ECF subfamily)
MFGVARGQVEIRSAREPWRNGERLRRVMSGCLDDQCLIAACRSGKTEAFGVLVSRYQDRLYPTVFRLTGCAEDAHDLLQEAFLRAYEKLGRFHGESSFYTWIYRIAVNLALSDRRKRRHESIAALLGDVPDDRIEGNPAATLERTERDERIQEALNALAPDHRAVVVMKEFDGLHYEEIGAMLGVPVGTVRSRLHRARCELRELLRTLIDGDMTVRPDAPDVTSLKYK